MEEYEFNKPLESHNWNGEKTSKWFSLPVIILFIIIFWPFGIYLAYRRTNMGEYATKHPGRGLLIIGIVMGGIALLDFPSVIQSGMGDTEVFSFLFFFIPGVVLLLMGFWVSKNAKRYTQYTSWINDGMTSLDSLSAAMGRSLDQTKKDLKRLIDKGYLGNAYIDENRGELILGRDIQYDKPVDETEIAAEPVAKRCPNCGAVNMIRPGKRVECEYCGSLIK